MLRFTDLKKVLFTEVNAFKKKKLLKPHIENTPVNNLVQLIVTFLKDEIKDKKPTHDKVIIEII